MAEIAQQARRGYQSVRRSSYLEALTRIGFLSKGVVYLLLGSLAIMAALHKGGQTTDQKGVIQFIAGKPFAEFALGLIAAGLIGYALWRFVCAISDVEGKGRDAKGLAARAGYCFSGIAHTGIALYAIKLLTGEPANRADSAKTWTARLMDWPGGTLLIALTGLTLIGAGIYQIRKGFKEEFKEDLHTFSMDGTEKKWAIRAGIWGHAARGVVFGLIGLFLIFAAWSADPAEAKGVEGVLDTVSAQPFGQAMLIVLAGGLACYGLYCIVEAKYRRIRQ
jgi:hypothetical protein